jgi:ferritin-like metal-binding protein YciE
LILDAEPEVAMAQKGLHEIFVDEVRDCYDAERQLVKALPRMAKAATSTELAEAFTSHLEETRGHVTKLERVFASLDQKPRGKHCDGMAGIIEEAKSILEEDLDEDTLDAALIAAGQRAEHYEMAAYGTLVAWAQVMGHDQAAGLLEEILGEEKAADKKLSSLAEGGINQQAAGNGFEDEEQGDDDEEEDDEDDEDEDEDDDSDDVDSRSARGSKGNGSTRAGQRGGAEGRLGSNQRSRPTQPSAAGRTGQGNERGRPASQLGKQVPANELGKRLQNQPGRTGSRRADR